MWVDRETTLKIASAGIIDFPVIIGWNHERSRAEVSDHAPLYAALGSARLDASTNVVPATISRSSSVATRPRQATPSLAASTHTGAISPGGVRGNRRSHIYHRPDCPSYNRIGANNRVEFPSAAAAASAGYRLAGNCR
tara:strand:+ start:100 stop:513 length:414 start_codon:yes stop_codon:yes gene_type:complete